jgi:hypothetical protein
MALPSMITVLTMAMPEAYAVDRHAQVVRRVLTQLAYGRGARHLWCHGTQRYVRHARGWYA